MDVFFILEFRFNMTRPVPAHERAVMLSAVAKLRELRILRREPTHDLDAFEHAVDAALPPALSTQVSALTDGRGANTLTIAEHKKRRTQEVLEQVNYNIAEAAEVLGLPKRSLYRYVQRVGLVKTTERMFKETKS